jgi:hypothetical protein
VAPTVLTVAAAVAAAEETVWKPASMTAVAAVAAAAVVAVSVPAVKVATVVALLSAFTSVQSVL